MGRILPKGSCLSSQYACQMVSYLEGNLVITRIPLQHTTEELKITVTAVSTLFQ